MSACSRASSSRRAKGSGKGFRLAAAAWPCLTLTAGNAQGRGHRADGEGAGAAGGTAPGKRLSDKSSYIFPSKAFGPALGVSAVSSCPFFFLVFQNYETGDPGWWPHGPARGHIPTGGQQEWGHTLEAQQTKVAFSMLA